MRGSARRYELLGKYLTGRRWSRIGRSRVGTAVLAQSAPKLGGPVGLMRFDTLSPDQAQLPLALPRAQRG
jgi:hypothetical protein